MYYSEVNVLRVSCDWRYPEPMARGNNPEVSYFRVKSWDFFEKLQTYDIEHGMGRVSTIQLGWQIYKEIGITSTNKYSRRTLLLVPFTFKWMHYQVGLGKALWIHILKNVRLEYGVIQSSLWFVCIPAS